MRVWKADWHSISNDVDDKPVYCGEERAKLDGLPVDLHSYPHLWTQALGSELKYWHHQHNQQIRDRVRSLVVLEGLKVESFLLHIKRSGMLPGCLQGELFWSCPIVRTLWGTPKRCWRDYISQKDCEYLGVFLEVLGEARGGGVTLVRLVHIQTMIVVDGWMALRIHCFSFFKISQTKTSPPQNSCTIRSMGQNRSFTLVKSESPFVTLIIQCYSWCYLSKSRILLASTSLSTMTTPQRCGDNHDMILQIFKKSKFKKHNSKLHEMNKTLDWLYCTKTILQSSTEEDIDDKKTDYGYRVKQYKIRYALWPEVHLW